MNSRTRDWLAKTWTETKGRRSNAAVVTHDHHDPTS